MKETRAEKAGKTLGDSLIELIHLMYQNKTALNFLLGLKTKIDGEFVRRKAELNKGDK